MAASDFVVTAYDDEIAGEVREFLEQAMDALEASRTDFKVTVTHPANTREVIFDVTRRSQDDA